MMATILLAVTSVFAGSVDAETSATSSYFGPPLARHAPAQRRHVGIPSVAVASNGRLWVTWYGGITPEEDANSMVFLTTSGDGGKTWQEVMVYDPDWKGPIRGFDPQVWIGPDGKMRWSWTTADTSQKGWEVIASHKLMVSTLDDPTQAGGSWSEPRHVFRGIMLGKPLVRKDGAWLLPVSHWGTDGEGARCVLTRDGGVTLEDIGHTKVPGYATSCDEHCFVELGDGTLRCYQRTNFGPAQSDSKDGGKTWTPATRCWLWHPQSRFAVCRLPSGNLLMIKHGSMEPVYGAPPGRERLFALLSKDDGKTWGNDTGFLLDERECSYPDCDVGPDGTIYVVYDHARSVYMNESWELCLAKFTEKDLLERKPDNPSVSLRMPVLRRSDFIGKAN